MPTAQNPRISPPPVKTPHVDGIIQYFSRPWIQWFQAASTAINQTARQDEFVGAPPQTEFLLSATPLNGVVQVFVAGAYQPKSAYTLNGTALTFGTAPGAGVEIEVNYTG